MNMARAVKALLLPRGVNAHDRHDYRSDKDEKNIAEIDNGNPRENPIDGAEKSIIQKSSCSNICHRNILGLAKRGVGCVRHFEMGYLDCICSVLLIWMGSNFNFSWSACENAFQEEPQSHAHASARSRH